MEFVDQMIWKENIKKWACKLGFVSTGFTTAHPIDGLAPLLQARFDQGLATPFESKDIRQRIDPQVVWQQCRTVVALAYPLPASVPPQKGEGVLARSAVGEDYHKVINQKMKYLFDNMIFNGWPGKPRWQADTGPLVERAFAVRAGIGWIGRNQQLIIPGFGSFAALALLLLDQEIPGDFPLTGQCGDCQRCVQACPARIIGKDQFAAKHCVSYLTQSKEVLNPEERQSLGTRIFGCDTCQEVCPHNQKRLEEEQKLSPPSLQRRGVDLLETLDLTKKQFFESYKLTAAGWRGKGVLQRNAFLALQNTNHERNKSWFAERIKTKSIPPIITPYLS